MSSNEQIIEDKDWYCCSEDIINDDIYTDFYKCPKCKGDMIIVGASYCQDCGVKLEWNLSGERG